MKYDSLGTTEFEFVMCTLLYIPSIVTLPLRREERMLLLLSGELLVAAEVMGVLL